MKKAKCTLTMIGLFAFLFLPLSGNAWVLTPEAGSIDWESYSRTFDHGFSGTVKFVVSNVFEGTVNSYLLLDNLSHGSNPGFEAIPDFSGYTMNGVGNSVQNFSFISVMDSNYDRDYSPPEGTKMAKLESEGGGQPTTEYSNAYGTPGFDGSALLLTGVTLGSGETFSFDWAFATDDWYPGLDFSLVHFMGTDSFSNSIDLQGELGQVTATVPLPAAVWLLGSGLIGLVSLCRRFER